ncbi:MAG TPA: HEAT repeat domain-containing protein, partial [Gemmataceae bacterium]|nr:HEAT repeat domain-containing protein [Gemmataceae bacterium]
TQPLIKADPGNWMKEVAGKNLEATIQDIKSNSDPAVREAAVRALPYFGPKARELGAANLMYALTRDTDYNVRVAALEVMPAVCLAMGYLNYPDKVYEDGLTAAFNLTDSDFYPLKLHAVTAVAAFGFYPKFAPRIVSKLVSQAKGSSSSYQYRRAAVAALAVYGQGVQFSEESRPDPDNTAVAGLIDVLKNDNSAIVRKEAVMSLIALGPVAAAATPKWRNDLEAVVRKEKDKSVLLWTRTCLVRNDPAGPKANAAHLDAIAETLNHREPVGRLEACQAFTVLAEDGVSKLRDLLTVAQNEKEPAIQAAAIGALATMKSQLAAILPILQAIISNPAANADVKKVATSAITELNKKDPAPMPGPMPMPVPKK